MTRLIRFLTLALFLGSFGAANGYSRPAVEVERIALPEPIAFSAVRVEEAEKSSTPPYSLSYPWPSRSADSSAWCRP